MGKKEHKIALITDSTSDIPRYLVQQHDIIVLPQILIWGTEELRNGVDIDAQAFYERLITDPHHPKTSQIAPQDYIEVIRTAQQSGAREIVTITLSKRLSGTYDSAMQAQEQIIDIPVHVVDSRSVSMGLGWQVIAAARVREKGGDATAMIAAADKVRETVALNLTVHTLEYLRRGGRIGEAVKLLGTALQIKPQLYVDHTTGLIEPGERTRTRRKALERMYELFFEQMDTSKPLHVAVLHAAAAQEAGALSARIEEECSPVEMFVGLASPVVGTHAGPGTIGLCGYYET